MVRWRWPCAGWGRWRIPCRRARRLRGGSFLALLKVAAVLSVFEACRTLMQVVVCYEPSVCEERHAVMREG